MYNHEPTEYQCPFCLFAKGGENEYNKQADVIYDDEAFLAFISPKWWPNNPGNVIVIPRTHIENVYDMPDDLLGKMSVIGKKIAVAMKQNYGCDGISFRQHNEPAGGQDIWHFHFHVLPRWKDDELYVNHAHSRFVSPEERKPYVDRLKGKV